MRSRRTLDVSCPDTLKEEVSRLSMSACRAGACAVKAVWTLATNAAAGVRTGSDSTISIASDNLPPTSTMMTASSTSRSLSRSGPTSRPTALRYRVSAFASSASCCSASAGLCGRACPKHLCLRRELFRGTGNYHRIIVARFHGERSAILNLHFEFVLYVCEQRILKIECPVISREIDFHARNIASIALASIQGDRAGP